MLAQTLKHSLKSCLQMHFKCAEKYIISVSIPRRCSRQAAYENHPGSTKEEYYQRSVAVTFFDHLISKTETRFSSHLLTAMKSLGIVPSCFSSSTDDELLQ